MREIKFRARNAGIPRCWIYGYFVRERGSNYIVNDDGKFQVIADSQCQYTGLHDKNGKEIFRSDLWKLGDEIYLIVWYEGDMQTGWKKKAGDFLTDIGKDTACRGEVIGNIYSTPELLTNTQASLKR